MRKVFEEDWTRKAQPECRGWEREEKPAGLSLQHCGHRSPLFCSRGTAREGWGPSMLHSKTGTDSFSPSAFSLVQEIMLSVSGPFFSCLFGLSRILGRFNCDTHSESGSSVLVLLMGDEPRGGQVIFGASIHGAQQEVSGACLLYSASWSLLIFALSREVQSRISPALPPADFCQG